MAQVFALLGLTAGLVVAGWVSQWVGMHWQGARPAVAFWLLRWVVAALAGLAVAALFQWWGDLLGKAVKAGPLGWLDRGGGFLFGAVLGLVVGAFALLVLLHLDWAPPAVGAAVRARVSAPVMHQGARACALAKRFVPGSEWLKQRFLEARRRALHDGRVI